MGLRDWALVSRFRMEIATIVNPLIGIFFAARKPVEIYDANILIYLASYLFIVIASSQLNCYFDMYVDRHYKKNLYRATVAIGGKKIKIVSSLLFFSSFLLALYLAYKALWITSLMICAGIVIALFYSMPPVRLKSRGIAGIIFLSTGLFMLPLMAGWFLLRSSLTVSFILFLLGYTFMNTSFILINIGEDFEEDLKEGIKTVFHVVGEKGGIKIARILLLTGIIMILLSIRGNINYFSIPFLAIFLFSSIFSYADLKKIEKGNVIINMKKYGRKVPIWFAITRYPLLMLILVRLCW